MSDFDGNSTPDAPPPDGPPDSPPPPDAPPPDTLACRDLVTTGLDTGHHYPGEECTGACHNGETGAGPYFSFGGTLYVNKIGQAPLAGATIHVQDAEGKTIEVVTSQNGNFWSQEALVWPVTTWASACPKVEPMLSIAPEPGNCNAANCHGTEFRIRIPPN